jgi:hypothetical protein
MRRLTLSILFLSLLVVGTAAAAKMKAYVGYDKNVDLGAIKTFDYRDTLDTSVIDQAPPVHEMIKLLIISKLQDGGMKWEKENPDVLVTYHTDANQAMRMNVTLYSYSYSAGWWWSPLWGSGLDVSSFTQGTLLVDIWDPKTENIVWRGAVEGVVPENPSAAKAQKTIEKALNLMSKEFHRMRSKQK